MVREIESPDINNGSNREVSLEGITYFAKAYKRDRSQFKSEFLILERDSSKVEDIVLKRAGKVFNWKRSSVQVEFNLVTPDEFLAIARSHIDRGIRLGPHILHLPGVEEYAISKGVLKLKE